MSGPLRVLLVDDNPDDRLLTVRALAREFSGAAVQEAGDLAALKRALAGDPPDLVITDYHLRWANGLEVLRQSKARWPECPVIMFTGTGTEEVAVEAMKSGLEDYVLKSPKHFIRLPAVVRLTLERARQRRKVQDAERAALVQGELLRQLVDAVPLGILLLGPEGEICTANPRAREFLSLLAEDLEAPGARVEQLAGIPLEALASPPEAGTEHHQLTVGDGTLRHFAALASPLGDASLLRGWVLALWEETRERELRERAAGQDRMAAVGLLAGGIAHDFNNVLTVISATAELALLTQETSGPVRRALDDILRASDRAAGLTRQLLAFARRQVLHPRLLSLNEVVSGLEKLLRTLLGEGVELATVLALDLHPVLADPVQMEQVLLNLAANARDAMPQGGTLTIATSNADLGEDFASTHPGSAPGPHVCLEVWDTGPGIPGHVLPHVFEPFVTTKAPGKGTGLGLSTVYGIVKQSGGSVYAENRPGTGAVVRIYLPRAEGKASCVVPAGARQEPRGGSETILAAEDDPAVRSVLLRGLEPLGYTVLTAAQGDEALALARAHSGTIDLLVTDAVMPGMSGFELAARLMQERPGLRVLYISGHPRDTSGDLGLPPGAPFLAKPFPLSNLARAVREVLDR
jgi:signal transduction histidine kinase